MTNKKVMEPRLVTRVDGLDSLLRGGFVLPQRESGSKNNHRGLVVLVKGRPGTGKTSLAMQLVRGALEWTKETIDKVYRKQIDDEKRRLLEGKKEYEFELHRGDEIKKLLTSFKDISVFSNEQDGDELKQLLKRLGIKDKNKDILKAKINIENTKTSSSDPFDKTLKTERWAKEICRKIGNKRHRMVILDGFNLLSAKHEVVEIEQLIEILREKSLVTVLIYDTERGNQQHLDYMVDMVISLMAEVSETEPKYLLNYIRIDKGRFQNHVLGWHQYKILKSGLVVYPSLHYRSHRFNLLDDRLTESEKNILFIQRKEVQSIISDSSALAYLLKTKNMKEGSCTLVLGARRTWKTLLTLDFLRAGSKDGQKGLLISLMDNQPTIVDQRKILCEAFCLNKKTDEKFRECNSKECYENVHLFHFRPGCIASSEFIYYLNKSIEYHKEQTEKEIKRLVFWDLTQLEYRFPLLAKDKLFIPLLMDCLKHVHKITSVFMGASNIYVSQAASAIADNVIFCWQDMKKNKNNRLISGTAFYVDRIEGKPESGQLFFKPDKIENADHQTPIEEIIKKEEFDNLCYAFNTREQIWAMQGFQVALGKDDLKKMWIADIPSKKQQQVQTMNKKKKSMDLGKKALS